MSFCLPLLLELLREDHVVLDCVYELWMEEQRSIATREKALVFGRLAFGRVEEQILPDQSLARPMIRFFENCLQLACGTHVDLYGPFGGLNVGRQYPVGHSYLMLVDPFGGGTAGQVLNLADVSGPYVSNAIRYMAPGVGGFNAAIEMGLGEPAHGSWADGREDGAALIYGSGLASLGITLYEVRNTNGFEMARRNVMLGGWYDFGVVKVHAMAQRSTGHPTGVALPLNVLDLMAGVTVPLAGGKVMATYTHHDDRTTLAQHGDQDARQLALGYLYWLSKRVSVYTAWARITNRNGGKLTVGNPSERGTGNKGFNLGMAYDF